MAWMLVAVAVVGRGVVAQEIQPRMGEPLDGLTADELDRFVKGAVEFARDFTEAEGLGPIFNQTGCGVCHANPLGGAGTITVTRAGLLFKGGFDPLTELGGSLFQQEAINDACREDVPPEANVVAHRVTNGMLGYGIVQAIPDADIIFHADNPPPGISGRVRMVHPVEIEDPSVVVVGRFGWKAHSATMLDFSAGAALNEVGITNRFHPEDNDPNGINPPALADCDAVPDPEDGPDAEGFDYIDRVTDFQRFLAPPPQTPRSGMTGEGIFMGIGCGDCHVASFTSADDPALEDAIRNKPVRPYSDFLLHNMGGGGDFIEDGPAAGDELKTAPLMGVRVRDPMWHDGRVGALSFESRILRAVAWHCASGSEAQASAQVFLNGVQPEGCDPELPCPTCEQPVDGLSDAERGAVIAFLDSLGRAEFDHDGDNDVDRDDYLVFRSCFTTEPVYTADDACAISDFDQDGDVDFADMAKFREAYTGSLE